MSVPTAAVCAHCGESREDVPDSEVNFGFHRECAFRLVAGSVGHLRRRCMCYVPGSLEDDPPGMTKREAARAACAEWRGRQVRELSLRLGFDDLRAGMRLEIRPHADYPWEQWTVFSVDGDEAAVEREMEVAEAIKVYGRQFVRENTVRRSRGTVFTCRLLAVRSLDGGLTDDQGHQLEMRRLPA